MINLIPNKEKKQMVRGFYYRLVVLFLVVLGTSFLIAFVAILPSYFLSSAREDIVNAKLERQKNEEVPIPDQQTLLVIQDLNSKLDIIEKSEKKKFSVSEKVINALILNKLPEIKISDISYNNDPKSTTKDKKIGVQGQAPSREVLLMFRRALEDDPNFKSVDLPISNFVRGSNIQFYLSLIPS